MRIFHGIFEYSICNNLVNNLYINSQWTLGLKVSKKHLRYITGFHT